METYIELNLGSCLLDLKELEALVSDIIVLSKKEISYEGEITETLEHPEIDERRICAVPSVVPGQGIKYYVEDCAFRRDGSGMTLVGSCTYESKDLRKKSRKA